MAPWLTVPLQHNVTKHRGKNAHVGPHKPAHAGANVSNRECKKKYNQERWMAAAVDRSDLLDMKAVSQQKRGAQFWGRKVSVC